MRGVFQNITDNLKMNGKFVSTILNGREVIFEQVENAKEAKTIDSSLFQLNHHHK